MSLGLMKAVIKGKVTPVRKPGKTGKKETASLIYWLQPFKKYVTHIDNMRVIIDLNQDEYERLQRVKGDRTYRELLADALDIKMDERTTGRPTGGIAFTSHVKNDSLKGLSFAELRKKLDAKAATLRTEEGKQRATAALDNMKNDESENRQYLKKLRQRG